MTDIITAIRSLMPPEGDGQIDFRVSFLSELVARNHDLVGFLTQLFSELDQTLGDEVKSWDKDRCTEEMLPVVEWLLGGSGESAPSESLDELLPGNPLTVALAAPETDNLERDCIVIIDRTVRGIDDPGLLDAVMTVITVGAPERLDGDFGGIVGADGIQPELRRAVHVELVRCVQRLIFGDLLPARRQSKTDAKLEKPPPKAGGPAEPERERGESKQEPKAGNGQTGPEHEGGGTHVPRRPANGEPFAEIYPLEFDFVDADRHPTLAGLAKSGQAVTLSITNRATGAVSFDDLGGGDACHLTVRIPRGVLKAVETIALARSAQETWQLRARPWRTPAEDSVGPANGVRRFDALELTRRGGGVLGPGDTWDIALDGVSADGGRGTRATRIEFDYASVRYQDRDLVGSRAKALGVVTADAPEARRERGDVLQRMRNDLDTGLDAKASAASVDELSNRVTASTKDHEEKIGELTRQFGAFQGDLDDRTRGLASTAAVDELRRSMTTRTEGQDASIDALTRRMDEIQEIINTEQRNLNAIRKDLAQLLGLPFRADLAVEVPGHESGRNVLVCGVTNVIRLWITHAPDNLAAPALNYPPHNVLDHSDAPARWIVGLDLDPEGEDLPWTLCGQGDRGGIQPAITGFKPEPEWPKVDGARVEWSLWSPTGVALPGAGRELQMSIDGVIPKARPGSTLITLRWENQRLKDGTRIADGALRYELTKTRPLFDRDDSGYVTPSAWQERPLRLGAYGPSGDSLRLDGNVRVNRNVVLDLGCEAGTTAHNSNHTGRLSADDDTLSIDAQKVAINGGSGVRVGTRLGVNTSSDVPNDTAFQVGGVSRLDSTKADTLEVAKKATIFGPLEVRGASQLASTKAASLDVTNGATIHGPLDVKGRLSSNNLRLIRVVTDLKEGDFIDVDEGTTTDSWHVFLTPTFFGRAESSVEGAKNDALTKVIIRAVPVSGKTKWMVVARYLFNTDLSTARNTFFGWYGNLDHSDPVMKEIYKTTNGEEHIALLEPKSVRDKYMMRVDALIVPKST